MDVDEEIPLKERGDTVGTTDQTDQTGDQETGFGGGDLLTDPHTDGDVHNQSIAIVSGLRPIEQIGGEEDPLLSEEQLTTVIDKKKGKLISAVFKFTPKKIYGESSRKLLIEGMELYRGGRYNRIIGAKFRGKKVIVWKSNEEGYKLSTSTDSSTKAMRNKFVGLVNKAGEEYRKQSLAAYMVEVVGGSVETPTEADTAEEAPVAENITEDGGLDPGASTSAEGTDEGLVTDAVVEEVSDNAADILLTTIQSSDDDIERRFVNLRIPYDDWRESRGIFKAGILSQEGSTPTERMELMDTEIEHWGDKAAAETDPNVKDLYETVVVSAKMTKDYIRMRAGLKPEFEDTMVILKDAVDGSDELRLERFKRWAKKNMVGISAIAISVAGLITGIISASRGALKAAAGGLGKFAGAVGRVLKKLGPVFAALGSLVSTALSWGAKGILWMANNVPRKKVKSIVLFFKKKDSADSEEFIFPKITNVRVTHGSIPNYVYTDGMSKSDMFREADGIFRSNINFTMTEAKFFADKFALVLDLRSSKDNEVYGSGAKVDGSSSGIKLAITKEVMTENVLCYIYVLSSSIVNISDSKFQNLER